MPYVLKTKSKSRIKRLYQYLCWLNIKTVEVLNPQYFTTGSQCVENSIDGRSTKIPFELTKNHSKCRKKILVKALEYRYQRIKCSFVDHLLLFVPVRIAFCYQTIIPYELFIQSLQQVLIDFPIFAGILVRIKQRFYIDCTNQGVIVEIDHVPERLSFESTHFYPQPEEWVSKLNVYDAFVHKKPLLKIKLRYYQNGMTIGYSWSHGLCDMRGLMMFLKALSLCAQEKSYETAHAIEDRDNFLKNWVERHQLASKPFSLSRYAPWCFSQWFYLIKHLCTSKRALYICFNAEEIEKLRDICTAKGSKKLSRNDVIGAYIFKLISMCRMNKTSMYSASIVINYLARLGILSAPLGNYLDTVPITFTQHTSLQNIAAAIHHGVEHYLEQFFCQVDLIDYFKKHKGSRKLFHMFPKDFMPTCHPIILSSFINMDVYGIDFGIEPPILFLPLTYTFFPCLCVTVEGYRNGGLLVYLLLPRRLSKRVSRRLTDCSEPII